MTLLMVGGMAVHCREIGQCPPVLLLHGGGFSGAQWKRVCELLAGCFHMATMDHYGFRAH